ncbi:MAG TPA: ABC transporter permease subunit [Kiritimatiellia bacterium]|nr:ABC transporter permease subunit [Kiritimatiellia bacterium]
MTRFLLRRFLHMIPTVGGVLLITFILFNLVGGSPALMTLGDKATPLQLEEFDEVRGFNRPLLFGWRGPTRALPFTDFTQSLGPWSAWPEATLDSRGFLSLPGPATVELPLAFLLFPNATYELKVRYRSDQPVKVHHAMLPAASDWQVQTLRIEAGDTADERRIRMKVEGTRFELAEVDLFRRMDSPWHSQFTYYLRHLARLDFGVSHSANEPVIDLLKSGIVPTLLLATPILFGELLISVVFALICARYRNRWPDRLLLVLSVALMSVNYLVWIVAGQYLLAFKLGWFPVWGFESWHYLLLPVLIGTLHGLGSNIRFYRTVMLDEMYKDYVRTAFAKGAGEARVLFRHVLPNAMIPVITNVVLSLPFLYTGSLLLESFFGIPGLGYLSVNAIHSSDVDVVRAVVLIGSVLYVVANLIADLLYAWVDPRVRLS